MFASLLLAACAPSQVVTGSARTPIAASAVVVYSAPPVHFEQIALLTASHRSLFTPGGQKAVDALMRHLCGQAARLGANGIILDQVFDQHALSLSAGAGSDTYTHNADLSFGIGALFGVYKKTADARAIFVPVR